MSNIQDLKNIMNKREIDQIKLILAPYTSLSGFFQHLENSINQLQEVKPSPPKRKRTPKAQVESEIKSTEGGE